MKNVFKTIALMALISISSCSKDDDAPVTPPASGGNLPGSFIKAEVGASFYDSTTGGGQTFATKTTLPFVGDQIAIASALGDTRTLNLTFFPPTTTGSADGILFYSPNGSAASSIGNDDNCPNVSCTINVTSNNGKIIEGTFNAVLQKADCTGATTPVVGGTFKAVVAQ